MIGRAFALAAALTAAVTAQPRQPLTFRSGVEVVELDVSVTRGGQPVTGLEARDFRVADNGVEQSVQTVALDRMPLSVTMALDTSSSVVGERLTQLLAAANGLLDALRPDDRAALLTFSHEVDLRVPLTLDRAALRKGVAEVAGGGATALRDAVQLALPTPPITGTRPLVLVFTDGADTASWVSEEDVVDSARKSSVVVHAIDVRTPNNAGSDKFLDRLTGATGGRRWSATSDRDLRNLFTRALEEMRSRYLLTFSPSGKRNAGWHELKVSLENGRADISARPGYFLPPTE
jgi:VWFA-related protein